jgi:hypothetical protein
MVIEIAVIVTLLASGLGLSTPLLFAALGEKISERAGVLNLDHHSLYAKVQNAGAVRNFFSQLLSFKIFQNKDSIKLRHPRQIKRSLSDFSQHSQKITL